VPVRTRRHRHIHGGESVSPSPDDPAAVGEQLLRQSWFKVGYVARRYNQRSSLGVILDPIADKGLLLSGIITMSISNWSEADADYGRFPAWFPVLVISRDAVILVGAVILYLLNGKVHVKPNWTGKVATVCQMCAIGWVMLQLRFLPLFLVVVVAGIFTIVSGVIYVLEGVRQ